MKRFALVVAVVFAVMSFAAVSAHADDNVLDKIGDWWAVRGKDEPERGMIIMQRRADRAAKRAGKAIEKSAKELDKSMKNIFGK